MVLFSGGIAPSPSGLGDRCVLPSIVMLWDFRFVRSASAKNAPGSVTGLLSSFCFEVTVPVSVKILFSRSRSIAGLLVGPPVFVLFSILIVSVVGGTTSYFAG